MSDSHPPARRPRASQRERCPLAVALLLSALGAGAPLHAQARPDTARRLEAVLVTAHRTPLAAAVLPQKIDVLDSAALARTPSLDLADALKKLAAVDVIQYPSLLAGVGIRGFRPEYSGLVRHTLLLVDGRPAGVSNLAMLDLVTVQRVEVLKGPASALYGSSAMGGAVNVVTRRSTGARHVTGTVGAGSFQTSDVALQAGGRIGAGFDGDVSGHWFSEGNDYRIGSGNTFRNLLGDGTATRILADGTREAVADLGDGVHRSGSRYHYQSGAARLGYAVSPDWRVDVRGDRFVANDVAAPGDLFFGDAQNGLKNVRRGSLDLALAGTAGRHHPLVRGYRATEDADYFDSYAADPYVSYASAADTRGWQVQDALQLGAQRLTFGVDYSYAGERSRSFSDATTAAAPYSPDASVTSGAAFTELAWTLLDDRLQGTAGVRRDHVSLVTQATPLRPDLTPGRRVFTSINPSLGAQYAFGENTRLHATVGRAFVAPNPFASAGLVASRSGEGLVHVTVGNPALNAERSVTVDVGLGVARPRLGLDVDVTYFHTQVDDRITSASAVFPDGGRPSTIEGDLVGRVTSSVNAGKATMHGLEVRGGVEVGALLGRSFALRLFGNGTRMFSATERVRSASLDASRFAGRTDFDPAEAASAIVYGAETSSRIRNVANLTVTAGLAYDSHRRVSGSVSGRYVGQRLDTDFTDYSNVADIEYPAFLVLDLSAGVRLTSRSRLDLLLTNVTDENYYETRGYPLAGRAAMLKLSVGR